jgi:hypothetical protein
MINELLEDHRTGQDATQLGSFVLGGRTAWGTYKKAIRELYKRIRGLRQMITAHDLLLIDMEEAQDRIASDDERDSRRAAIELRAMSGQLEESERNIRDTKREAALCCRVANELKNEFGEITEERRSELDREEWRWWHLKRAAISKLTTGRVDDVTLKNLISLPISERDEWLSVIKDDKALIELVDKSEYGRHDHITPTDTEIKQIEQEINQ